MVVSWLAGRGRQIKTFELLGVVALFGRREGARRPRPPGRPRQQLLRSPHSRASNIQRWSNRPGWGDSTSLGLLELTSAFSMNRSP